MTAAKDIFWLIFYVAQRKQQQRLQINGQPTGGKWTFDAESRERFSKYEIELI
ncbi:cryptochrome/photolyase family protein [Hymenobacter elongatus]|uniref:cryptochrome/photolyase family protein n=1 Tax=Hymenobacter elongatus TaxID=877208 RepID=UPI0021D3EBB9|nr:cryptochrome/photolyase family protein [Hymenobacter elongatus]